MNQYKLIAAIAVGALLAGCSANGAAAPPNGVVVPITTSTVLQFAVGTANMGQVVGTATQVGRTGLNFVATFRQANGLTATLVNSPTITGPAGFTAVSNTGVNLVPSGDAGTNHLSAAPQNLNPAIVNPVVTFAQTGGVFAYGFAPENEGVTGAAVFTRYTNPFFVNSASTLNNLNYGGGPPAYPFFRDGTFPSGFTGYSQGFIEMNIAPVAGTYTLSDTIATGNAGTTILTATGTLADMVPLPDLPAPVFTQDGAGGGTGTITIGADARTVETMVYFFNASAGTFFAIGPIRGTGVQAFTLPDFLGPCGGAAGTGCQNNVATQTRTINVGNTFRFYAATYDYPMFEASPPGNVSQTPTIKGANGQADISTSPATQAVGI